MSTFKQFEDFEVWQLAREIASEIWMVSNQGSFKRDYTLKDQINKASGSIMDNIAEGFGRGGNREFVNFLTIARGSNHEVRSQLYRALDREHLSIKEFKRIQDKASSIAIKLSNLIRYLQSTDFKGQKFKEN